MERIAMPELTIICVCYGFDDYEQYLKPSLEAQDQQDYQLLLVDNSQNRFPNMAEAVASVAPQVTGDYVMLVHPDIVLLERDYIRRAVEECRRCFPEYALLGAAGAREDGVYARLFQGGGYDDWIQNNVMETTPVQTLDECLLLMPREVFKSYPLADLGKTWHFYSVELCCRLGAAGKKIAVAPVPVMHISQGTRNKSFFFTRAKVAWRFRRDFSRIYTTCGEFDTGWAYLAKGFPHELYWLFMKWLKRYLQEHMPGSEHLFRMTAAIRQWRIKHGLKKLD